MFIFHWPAICRQPSLLFGLDMSFFVDVCHLTGLSQTNSAAVSWLLHAQEMAGRESNTGRQGWPLRAAKISCSSAAFYFSSAMCTTNVKAHAMPSRKLFHSIPGDLPELLTNLDLNCSKSIYLILTGFYTLLCWACSLPWRLVARRDLELTRDRQGKRVSFRRNCWFLW